MTNNTIPRMFDMIFGRGSITGNRIDNAKPALYSGPDAAGRFTILQRRDKWGKTHALVIPVHAINDEPMYHLGDDGKPIEDKNGDKMAVTVPLYNSFLEDDIQKDKVELSTLRYIDISALLRDKHGDEQSLIVKHAIQRDLANQLMACKKGNAVDIPVRLLVCSDLEYAKTRSSDFFISPQDMIAYGKALVTSHETIAKGKFRFLVCEEGQYGTADGQSRISIPLARELGYEGYGQLQFRLEFGTKLLVTGSTVMSTLGHEVDMIIPISNFKGGNAPEVGTYFYKGRLGIMCNGADRTLTIRDNMEVQHYYDDLNWGMVDDGLNELIDAHRNPRKFLELIKDTEYREGGDNAVFISTLKAINPDISTEAMFVAEMMIRHPKFAEAVHDYILSKYADIAKCAGHKFDGAYLACLDDLPDDTAYFRGSSGTEWVFRIPMLSAANFVKLTMISEENLIDMMKGDPNHDAEILAARYNKGSIFVNSKTAAKLNSDFDMDPMCRCPESDPYYEKLTNVAKEWGDMTIIQKDKVRSRSDWHRFGVSEAVSSFLAAPNIGAQTLLQDNIMMRKDDPIAIRFCKSVGLTVKEAATLVGLAISIAVDSHKWTSSLTVEEQELADKLLKFFTGKSQFYRNVVAKIRAGNTNWKIDEPTNIKERLVLKVRDAQKENNLGDLIRTFKPGNYVGFLGIPEESVLEEYRPEIVGKMTVYNKSIARIIAHTKDGSPHRKEAISEITDENRRDFAYMRATVDSDTFIAIVQLAWDVAHEAASRSKHHSKASFITSAGVMDVVVECLNRLYGGIGNVKAVYSEMAPDEYAAPRICLFDGWRMYVGKGINTRKLLDAAFRQDDENAMLTLKKAMDAWLREVTGKVKIGVRTSYDGRSHTTCLFKGKRIIGDIRTRLVNLGDYEVDSAVISGVNIVVSLKPAVSTAPAQIRHKMKLVGLWQDVVGTDSKAVKVSRTVKMLKQAARLVSVEVVPGTKGVELHAKGTRLAMVVANSVDESLVLGKVKVVDVQYETGKASAAITVDRVH